MWILETPSILSSPRFWRRDFARGFAWYSAVWPDYLPRVQYDVDLTSPPVPVDLTPEEGGENEDTFKAINQAGQIVNRLEINRLVLRLERADFNVPLPELEIQVADTLDADPNDRLAWFTIGRIEAGESNAVARDLEFQIC